MKSRQALHLCRLAALGLFAASALHADPLRDPKRVVNGQTVDLRPLFDWWRAPDGARPLSAWVRVTGPIVGTSVWGWTLDAEIQKMPLLPSDTETNLPPPPPRLRLMLKYPPQQDQAEFDRLVARRQALGTEQIRLSDLAAAAAKRADAAARQYDPTRPWKLWSSAASDDYATAKAAQADAERQLKAVEAELAGIARKLAVYPDPNQYVVDCFALETTERQNGLPVFAHGMVLK